MYMGARTWACESTRRAGTLPAGADASTAHLTSASEPFCVRTGGSAAPVPELVLMPVLLPVVVPVAAVAEAAEVAGGRSSHSAAASSEAHARGST